MRIWVKPLNPMTDNHGWKPLVTRWPLKSKEIPGTDKTYFEVFSKYNGRVCKTLEVL